MVLPHRRPRHSSSLGTVTLLTDLCRPGAVTCERRLYCRSRASQVSDAGSTLAPARARHHHCQNYRSSVQLRSGRQLEVETLCGRLPAQSLSTNILVAQ